MEALVIVDLQKDFCYPDGALYIGDHVKKIFGTISKVVKFARGKIPVIFTQDWHRKDDLEFKIWPPHCIAGSKGAEIIDEVEVDKERDYFIKKRRYSAFFETDFDLLLRELNIRKLYFGGVVVSICVLHTAVDAFMRGYQISLLKDCTAGLTDYDYNYALDHFEKVLKAEIITSNEFIKRLK